jgi:hypothetical protein
MFQSIAASFQGGGIVTPAAAGVNKFSRSQMRDRRARLTMIVSESRFDHAPGRVWTVGMQQWGTPIGRLELRHSGACVSTARLLTACAAPHRFASRTASPPIDGGEEAPAATPPLIPL